MHVLEGMWQRGTESAALHSAVIGKYVILRLRDKNLMNRNEYIMSCFLFHLLLSLGCLFHVQEKCWGWLELMVLESQLP